MAKEENKIVLDLAREFLTAVMERKDWHPFAQLRTRQMKTAPNIPAFSDFKVLRTQNPGQGLDPTYSRTVFITIRLGGNEQLKLQDVPAKLQAVKEVGWEPCVKCHGTGQAEDESVCPACRGTGKTDVKPPRIPEKGTPTFEHDDENSVWGICPTSFQFVDGERKLVKQ